jgi:hypothetical protein
MAKTGHRGVDKIFKIFGPEGWIMYQSSRFRVGGVDSGIRVQKLPENTTKYLKKFHCPLPMSNLSKIQLFVKYSYP